MTALPYRPLYARGARFPYSSFWYYTIVRGQVLDTRPGARYPAKQALIRKEEGPGIHCLTHAPDYHDYFTVLYRPLYARGARLS